MRDVLDNFGVTTGRFTVVSRRSQSTTALESRPFQSHSLHFAFFCFGKLGGYHDQAEIDHEKRTDLVNVQKILV